MNEDYSEPIKNDNPCRLEHPFIIYMSGNRGSGKTFTLLNLLILDDFYNDTFDKIYFVCPSFYQDPKYGVLELPKSQIFTEYKPEVIEKLCKNKSKDEEILIILDDCITQDHFKQNTGDNILNTIAVNGRHMGVSLIIASQKTSGASSFIRSQADGVYLWRPRSLNEIEAVYRDNSVGCLNKREFIALFDYCTNEKYNFMFINYQNNKVFHNFNELYIVNTKSPIQNKIISGEENESESESESETV